MDPLSENLFVLRDLLTNNPDLRHYVPLRIRRNPRFEQLIKDPLSLPLSTPQMPEGSIRDTIKEHMPTFIQNKAVKPLFTASTEHAKELLISDLSRLVPCNPRLLHQVFANSSIGLQEKIIGTFASTASIVRMALNDWTNELEVYQHVKDLEKDVWSSLLQRNEYPVLPKTWTCSTKLAQHLRTSSWQRNIEGTTMPPFMEMLRVTSWSVEEVTSRTILVYSKDIPTRQMFYVR